MTRGVPARGLQLAVGAAERLGLRPDVLGVGELLVDLLGLRLELGQPAPELVDLGLELHAARLEVGHLPGRVLERRRGPVASRFLGSRQHAPRAAARAFASASGSGTTCSSGRPAAPLRRPRRPWR